jgi:hypothetical protein
VKRSTHWIFGGCALVASAAAIACGATANAPGGAEHDAGKLPIYDGGSDYNYDDGGDGSVGEGCTDTESPENCGVCGNACPGLGAAAANVTCAGGEAGAPTCAFSCQGENYDVDQDASDGCEKKDAPTGNHTSLAPVYQGSFSCTDGDSAQNMTGTLLSDERTHEDPSVTGFSPATGSASDYFSIFGSGGSCDDDLNLHLAITGSTTPACYVLTAVTTTDGTYTCTASATTGACDISNGSGSYADNSLIVVSVSKVCSNATHEAASYTITGHL